MKEDVYKKIDKFFSNFHNVNFEKGEIIIHPDEKIQNIFLLKKGQVKMYAVSDSGQEITLHIFRSPSLIPIMLLLSKIYGKYYFEALGKVDAIKAPADEVIEFIKNDNEVLFDLTNRFSDAISGLILRIETLAFEDAYGKIASLLLYFSEKFGEAKEDKAIISMSLLHEDIANWVGLRRETVSRQFEKMQKQGILESKNKELIINLRKLKDAANH
jgi:CRP/FNR family transcriptional regulator